MKRLLIVLAAVAAFMTLAFGVASAKADSGGWKLTLNVSPTTMTVNDYFKLSGMLTQNGVGVAGMEVDAFIFSGEGCVNENYVHDYYYGFTRDDGSYGGHSELSLSEDFGLGAGTYSFLAYQPDNDVVGDCVNLTITEKAAAKTPPPSSVGVFLCYSKWQVEPGVWPFGIAQQLMAGGGYWMPYAVAGNVDYGTNIGGYHLVCNPAATQSVTGSMLGAGENVLSPGDAKTIVGDTFGPYYPIVGG